MVSSVQAKILSSLNLSKEQALGEMALLSAYQKLAEFSSEVDYFENKYKKSFKEFVREFRKKKGDYERENDWLSWKFALEGCEYWNDLLKNARK